MNSDKKDDDIVPLQPADDVTIADDNDVIGIATCDDVIEDYPSSSCMDSTGGDSSRNIFEENICSKDDIYSDDTSSLSSASFLAEGRGGGGVVVFDTKTCGLATDQNANFITEVT